MKMLYRIAIAFIAAFIMFVLYTLGVRLESLLTQHTDLYYKIQAFGAILMSLFVGIFTFIKSFENWK